MKKFYTLVSQIFLILFTFTIFYSCKKGPSNSSNGSASGCNIPLDSMAVFTPFWQIRSPNATFCEGTQLLGPALKKNVPLSTDNQLEILARVQKMGVWTAFTDTVNGIWYSGTGTFYSPDAQQMILQGYGTPKESGSFVFKQTIGNVKESCWNIKFEPNNAPPPPSTGNILPIANAGADILIALPSNSIKLIGSGIDPDGSVCAYQWTKISGPSAAIASPLRQWTNVTNLVQGVYKFELKVTDNQGASKKDTMQLSINPPDKAAFNLVSSDMQCVSSTQFGWLTVGVPATSSTFYTVGINVTKTGTWSLSTQTVNGVTFSGSGIFNSLGVISVHLFASGTPTAPAKYAYAPFVEFPGCSVAVEIVSNTPAPPTYYYFATINGVYYHQEANNIDFRAGSSLGGTDDVDFSADIGPVNLPPPANATSLEITKGLMHHYLSVSDADFRGFFIPGNYPYTNGPETNPYQNGNGVYIIWTDPQGNFWSTTYGSHDQTGSTFSIISVQDAHDGVRDYVKVKMRFSCKLYKQGTGEMKQLTNGEMVSLFGKL
jgi:hypothetical protein